MIQGDDVGRIWPLGSPELTREGKRQVGEGGNRRGTNKNPIRKKGDGKPICTHLL